MGEMATVSWTEEGQSHQARWLSESGAPAPRQLLRVDDATKANDAYRLASEGTACCGAATSRTRASCCQALARRIDRKPRARASAGAPVAAETSLPPPGPGAARPHLGMLLLPFEADHTVPLRRAPDVRQACLEAYGPADAASSPRCANAAG